jgi:hypothetical protein
LIEDSLVTIIFLGCGLLRERAYRIEDRGKQRGHADRLETRSVMDSTTYSESE